MRWGPIRGWLLPGAAEKDEGFRQEILSASYRGLRVVGIVEVVVAVLCLAGFMRGMAGIGIAVVAAATLGIAAVGAAYPHSRLLALVSCGAASMIAVDAIMSGAPADFALGTATFLILAAVTAVPLLPLQSLGMTAAVLGMGVRSGHTMFFALMAVAATSIAATLYEQRLSHYHLYLDTLRTSAELRQYQQQVMRAESSGTMVRLTAALAHELSQPAGVLASGIDSLLAMSSRPAPATPEAQQRMASLQSDLSGMLHGSLERLRKTVNRIQRLTNLDEAAMQQANLNELVNDALGLVKLESPAGTRFELDLRPMPDVQCRPQQVIAVLCSLLSNSIKAVNGDGRIAISTAARDSLLELTIEDNGRGIPPERLHHIFDPGFEVAEGRVSTGNWSLFTSRQYIKEHGGDIRIQSLVGKGTSVCLTLPAAS
jgi:signal transduction histidine kinase